MVTEDSAHYTRTLPTVIFADAIALSGYRWRTEGAQLKLSLDWDVLRAPGGDYKLFVHLLDASGALVGQYDAIPCACTCPTSGWQAGQHIHDSATLQLWNLPAGDYFLAEEKFSRIQSRNMRHPITCTPASRISACTSSRINAS